MTNHVGDDSTSAGLLQNLTALMQGNATPAGPGTPPGAGGVECAAASSGPGAGGEYVKFYHTARAVTGLYCYPIVCFVGLVGECACAGAGSRGSRGSRGRG